MATLNEILLAPDVQPTVVADCERLVNHEVADLSGITGTAVKLAYTTVRTFDAGHIRAMIETILPNVADTVTGCTFRCYLTVTTPNDDDVRPGRHKRDKRFPAYRGRQFLASVYLPTFAYCGDILMRGDYPLWFVARTGQMIDDRYRLDERIAAGGVGRVWLATDLLLERPVAVKLLRPEYAEHQATLARFRKEARHAGALSHPCVAQVYDYGHAGPGGPPFLVMEYVDGPSLADLLAVDPVEPAFAVDVIAQVASGLAAAHRIGLVHRDVKPGNILIGPDGRVKITDFGIAYAAGQTPVTGPGLVMGTSQYMAPERIDGGPGTPASDLYALGIVLHECLTGVPPYDGTPAEVMAGHLHAPLPPLPAFVPPELDALVSRLTAKDPASRISDAGDLAALATRLRDHLAAGPRAGDYPRAGLVQGRPVPTGRPTVTADLAAGNTDAHPPPGAALPDPVPPARTDRAAVRRRRPMALAAGAVLLAGAGIAGLLAAGTLSAAPGAGAGAGAGAGRTPTRSSPSPGAPVTGVLPSPAGGSASSGAAAGTVSPTTAAAKKHPAGRDGTPSATASGGASGGPSGGASGGATPSASPPAATSPAPGASPTPGGSASATPTPTPTAGPSSSPPASPSPTPSPAPSGILPSLPVPLRFARPAELRQPRRPGSVSEPAPCAGCGARTRTIASETN